MNTGVIPFSRLHSVEHHLTRFTTNNGLSSTGIHIALVAKRRLSISGLHLMPSITSGKLFCGWSHLTCVTIMDALLCIRQQLATAGIDNNYLLDGDVTVDRGRPRVLF